MKETPFSVRLSRDWPEVQVLYLDADLLAIDKPAGLLAAPDPEGRPLPNAPALLQEAAVRGGWAPEGVPAGQLAGAQRMDPDISGVLLLAWHRPALAGLLRQVRARTMEETYLGLVHGEFEGDAETVEALIGPERHHPGLSCIVARRGARAKTKVQVRERLGAFTLVEAVSRTCRHHQVRVHLRHIGHSLVGDPVYGGRPLLLSELKRHYKPGAGGERPLLGRPGLHAQRVSLLHPVTGQPLIIEAPLPHDIEASLSQLRRLALAPRRLRA